MTAKETAEAYMAAWSEQDPEKRKQLLQKTWADDATYTDPTAHAVGRDALSDLIAQFHQQMPGAALVITTGVDQHHDRLRFGWKLQGEDGAVRMEGIDVGQLTEDGRLKSIVGFFGPMPPA